MSAQFKSRALRGVKPKESKGRLKVFIYGESGSGKSYFCTQFPKPYYIDSEKGVERAKYAKNIELNDGVVFQTRNFHEIYEEVKLLSTIDHDYQTLVIDPITPIYNNLVDECLVKARGKTGYGQHYSEAAKQFQKLIDLLLAIDMNVVITAHVKKEYGANMDVIGTTFDAYKKINFLFDVVIETLIKQKRYIGISKKSRLVSLGADEEFDFSYENFHSLYEKELQFFTPKKIDQSNVIEMENPSKKVIEKALERNLPEQMGQVTTETLSKLLSIMERAEINEDLKDIWLNHFEVDNFKDLKEFQANRLIHKILYEKSDFFSNETKGDE